MRVGIVGRGLAGLRTAMLPALSGGRHVLPLSEGRLVVPGAAAGVRWAVLRRACSPRGVRIAQLGRCGCPRHGAVDGMRYATCRPTSSRDPSWRCPSGCATHSGRGRITRRPAALLTGRTRGSRPSPSSVRRRRTRAGSRSEGRVPHGDRHRCARGTSRACRRGPRRR